MRKNTRSQDKVSNQGGGEGQDMLGWNPLSWDLVFLRISCPSPPHILAAHHPWFNPLSWDLVFWRISPPPCRCSRNTGAEHLQGGSGTSARVDGYAQKHNKAKQTRLARNPKANLRPQCYRFVPLDGLEELVTKVGQDIAIRAAQTHTGGYIQTDT
jgi:hypothetical protein